MKSCRVHSKYWRTCACFFVNWGGTRPWCKVTWLVCWLKNMWLWSFSQNHWYLRVKFNAVLQNKEDNKTQSVLKNKNCRVNSISIWKSLFQFMTWAFIHLHVLHVKISRTDIIELNHYKLGCNPIRGHSIPTWTRLGVM